MVTTGKINIALHILQRWVLRLVRTYGTIGWRKWKKMYANEKKRQLYGSKSALTLVISLFEIKSVKGRLCKYDHFNHNNSCKMGII